MKVTRFGAALLLGGGFAAGVAAAPFTGALVRQFRMQSAFAQGMDQVTYRALSLFGDVLDRVRGDYVDPVSDATLITNALNGMLTGLDPHSAYMTEQQWHEMQSETTGRFGGIGLEVTDKDGFLEVISPIDGTPAAKAGVRSGDLITAVNGKSVEGVSLDDAVSQMRGSPGSTVSLIIKRQRVENPIVLTLTRQIIKVETVKSRLMDDVGMIRISEFTEQTASGLKAALASLRNQSGGRMRGLVLDLRNDPGGLLDQAITVSNDFLDHGDIVSTRGRHPDDNESWSARPGGDISGNLPVVVLINNGTASAAEIVAAALQDDKRALVLGTRSFGKGSVQTLIPLPGHGALRLTTARYYTPSGRSIQGLGITPNVEVQQTREPPPHFAPEREADLHHILAMPGETAAGPAPPAAYIPAEARLIPKLPPEGWPAIDPANPATDFQLQQGLALVRAMASDVRTAQKR